MFVIQIFLLIGQCVLFCKYWVDVQCSYYWYWVEINYLDATFTWYVEHNTGIPRFTLLMLGHMKKRGKQKPRKSRLLGSTKGEENRIEL